MDIEKFREIVDAAEKECSDKGASFEQSGQLVMGAVHLAIGLTLIEIKDALLLLSTNLEITNQNLRDIGDAVWKRKNS